MNVAWFSGRLGKDPEVKFFDEKSVTNFSIAVDRRVKGEKVTDWYNCSVWGKSGETVAEYFKKGDGINVYGQLAQRKYESDKGQGVSMDLEVKGWSFPPSKKETSPNGGENVPF